ncbi:MAG: hypothetical protein J0H44_11695 [Alphaproteobacteria bacterium]|nr:hypothetical protein [Alphaproteobacteria bacterium]
MRAVVALGVALVLALVGALASAPAEAQSLKVVALGTSFTAGSFVTNDKIWPTKLQQLLAARGEAAQVVNAGVAGETTRNLLARMDYSVPEGTTVAILEYSVTNDDRGGISFKETVANVEKMARRLLARARPPQVVIFIRGKNAKDLLVNQASFQPLIDEKHLGYVTVVTDYYGPGQHPSAQSHAQYAELLAPVVGERLAHAREASAKSPQ